MAIDMVNNVINMKAEEKSLRRELLEERVMRIQAEITMVLMMQEKLSNLHKELAQTQSELKGLQNGPSGN